MAEADVGVAKAEIELAQLKVSECKVLAPADGIISYSNAVVGSAVKYGEKAVQMQVYEPHLLTKVEGDLVRSAFAIGRECAIEIGEGKTIPGRVTEHRNLDPFGKGERSHSVTIRPTKSGELLIGMKTVTVVVTASKEK